MPGKYGQGRGGRPWRRLRDAVALRDSYTCQACGRVTTEGDCDHKVPTAKGGKTEMENLQWLCRTPCHSDKSEREAAEAQGRTVIVRATIGVDGWPVGR